MRINMRNKLKNTNTNKHEQMKEKTIMNINKHEPKQTNKNESK